MKNFSNFLPETRLTSVSQSLFLPLLTQVSGVGRIGPPSMGSNNNRTVALTLSIHAPLAAARARRGVVLPRFTL